MHVPSLEEPAFLQYLMLPYATAAMDRDLVEKKKTLITAAGHTCPEVIELELGASWQHADSMAPKKAATKSSSDEQNIITVAQLWLLSPSRSYVRLSSPRHPLKHCTKEKMKAPARHSY